MSYDYKADETREVVILVEYLLQEHMCNDCVHAFMCKQKAKMITLVSDEYIPAPMCLHFEPKPAEPIRPVGQKSLMETTKSDEDDEPGSPYDSPT